MAVVVAVAVDRCSEQFVLVLAVAKYCACSTVDDSAVEAAVGGVVVVIVLPFAAAVLVVGCFY